MRFLHIHFVTRMQGLRKSSKCLTKNLQELVEVVLHQNLEKVFAWRRDMMYPPIGNLLLLSLYQLCKNKIFLPNLCFLGNFKR